MPCLNLLTLTGRSVPSVFSLSLSPKKMTAEEAAEREIKEFIQIEQVKMEFQQRVHEFTDRCWDKCIGKISGRLDRSEENCMGNCVDRFLDSSRVMAERLTSRI